MQLWELPREQGELDQRITSVEEALMFVNFEAENWGVSPEDKSAALNFALDSLYAENPELYRQIAPRHIAKIYTPGISPTIERYLEGLEAGVVPQQVDAAKIDFDGQLLEEYKEEATKEKAIEKMRGQIEEYCRLVYENFRTQTETPWDELGPEAKKDLMRKAIAVITDGSRILGIGYQGEKGRKICSGKLRCYFLGSDGAVLPQYSFPFGVNFGTKDERETLIESGDYEDYMHLVLEAFDSLEIGMLQFEDFEGEEAWKLLKWARENLKNTWVFNDDIEGTAAMMAEAFLKMQQEEVSLEDSMFLFVGAGGAGSGIFQHGWWLIEDEMKAKGAETTDIEKARQAKEKIFFFDSKGLLYQGRTAKTSGSGQPEFQDFQREDGLVMTDEDMLSILRDKLEGGVGGQISVEQALDWFGDKLGERGSIVLLGTSTQSGAITEKAVVKARSLMGAKNPEKDIYLIGSSNPTKKTDFLTKQEAKEYEKTEDPRILAKALLRLHKAAEGKIRFATGSPFPTIEKDIDGRVYRIRTSPAGQEERDFLFDDEADGQFCRIEPGQGNNILIFPGMFGILLSGITPGEIEEAGYSWQQAWKNIWQAATRALFEFYQREYPEKFKQGVLFPKAEQVAAVSEEIAFAVANTMRQMADRQGKPPLTLEEFKGMLAEKRKMIKSPYDKVAAARAFYRAGRRYLESATKREVINDVVSHSWMTSTTEIA